MKKYLDLAVIIYNIFCISRMDFNNLNTLDYGVLITLAALLAGIAVGYFRGRSENGNG